MVLQTSYDYSLALRKTLNMDATSGQEAALTPNSQFVSQDLKYFSINDLRKRAEEFQKR
jgi:hypothetical protein